MYVLSTKTNRLSQLALGLVSVVPFVVSAQDKGTGLEEIVVTAQRREEKIQDVPLAVTALSGDQLEAAGVVKLADLNGKVPNLLVMPGIAIGRQVPTYAIRGLSQQDWSILADPAVTVYINDVPVPRTHGSNMSFFDIGSLEVLKGPQGTLFGRNTTGGAILIRPNRPVSEFQASVSQMFGNRGAMETQAMLNLPVGEWGALRIAGQHLEEDGYITDVITGKKIDYLNQDAGRISFSIRPNERFESLFTASLAKADDGGTGQYLTALPAGVAAPLVALQAPLLAAQQQRGFYETASGVPAFTQISAKSIDNTTTVHLSDSLVVKNIIGYREVNMDQLEDPDGSTALLLTSGIEHFNPHQVSEELQLQGSHGWLDWIAGGFYFREAGTTRTPSVGLGAGSRNVDPGLIEPFRRIAYYAPQYANTIADAENTSTAVFAQGTFNLEKVVEGLSLTVGIRQNWDKREAVVKNVAYFVPPAVPVAGQYCRFTLDQDNNPATPETRPSLADCRAPLSKSFSETTYNISLEYKINSDALVYLAHRHGYRTGGWGLRSGSQQALEIPFRPEFVDDIELGTKADWQIGSTYLRTNIAAFFAKYDDIQRQLNDPRLIPTQTVNTNAGKAEIKGGEFEFVFKPIDALQFSGHWSYTDAEFTKFIAPDGTDLSNAPFARAPKNIYGGTATLMLPTALGQFTGSVSYSHIDRFVSTDSYDPLTWAQNVGLWGMDLQLAEIAGTGADISLFVENALDKKYLVPSGHLFQLFKADRPGEPRTYGVRLRYHFGAR